MFIILFFMHSNITIASLVNNRTGSNSVRVLRFTAYTIKANKGFQQANEVGIYIYDRSICEETVICAQLHMWNAVVAKWEPNTYAYSIWCWAPLAIYNVLFVHLNNSRQFHIKI